MPFLKTFNKDFYIKDNRIILNKEYLLKNSSKFKKITGSRFASILDQSSYTSPVKTWAMMVNIYSEPMDEMYAKAGNIIEPKICKFVCEKTNIKYIQYDPKKIGFDIFKDNKIFGGIPDGEPVDQNGNLLYPSLPMLEIKTTSIDSFVFKKENNLMVLQKDSSGKPIVKKENEKKQKWFNSNNQIIIPNEYMFQLGLYCYLRNIQNAIFAVCFLETNDYINPQDCDVNSRDVRIVDFNVNLDEFKQYINYATNWYNDYIVNGISPELSKDDIRWLNSELNIDLKC